VTKLDLAVRSVSLIVLAALLTAVTIKQPYRHGPPIRADGAGYHAWTRAIVRGEFSFCIWEGQADLISYVDRARQMCQNKYPPGLAILQLPFMLPLLDLTPGAPLISPAEHWMCLALGALSLWISAALLSWSAAMLRVSAWRSTLILTAAVVGTGLYHYGTFDASFSHVHSALFVALLITLAIRERQRGRSMPIALLALAGFFMVAIRMTSAILLAELGLAYLIWHRRRLRSAVLRGLLPAALGGALAIAIQLAYNRYAVGRFTLSSYGAESFVLDEPMQLAVVASYERGLVSYFPLFGLALALGFAVRAARGWTALLAVQTASLVMLYGYWHSWMLGGGFGHRGFVELGPLVAIVLFVSLRALPRPAAMVFVVGAGSCAVVTLQVMLGYWRGSFPMGGATAVQYWQHLRMLESALSGGTQCRPAHCNLLKWRCSHKPQREFAACSLNFGEPGSCTADGQCAAIVAIRSLASDKPTRYVMAPPFSPKRTRPLVASAERIGPWEKFRLVPASRRDEVRLQSLHTHRYVALRAAKGGEAPILAASAETADGAATFIRVGRDSATALRTPDAKYVRAPPTLSRAIPMTADADEIGPSERFALEPTLP